VAEKDLAPSVNSCLWLLEAFYELSTTRSFTMGGASMIPVDKIWAWADRFRAPSWFDGAIMTIDQHWMKQNG
jgi:hypothetical protein